MDLRLIGVEHQRSFQGARRALLIPQTEPGQPQRGVREGARRHARSRHGEVRGRAGALPRRHPQAAARQTQLGLLRIPLLDRERRPLLSKLSGGGSLLGAFAFGIGATEMASIWTLGVALNIEVPPTLKVVVEGALPPHVGPKDLILHLVGTIGAEGANYRVIEFHGGVIRRMSTSGRLTLCNMSVEAGATSGIVPADAETLRYLREEAGHLAEVSAV